MELRNLSGLHCYNSTGRLQGQDCGTSSQQMSGRSQLVFEGEAKLVGRREFIEWRKGAVAPFYEIRYSRVSHR